MLPRDDWYKQLQLFIELVVEAVRLLCVAVVLLAAYLVMRVKGF